MEAKRAQDTAEETRVRREKNRLCKTAFRARKKSKKPSDSNRDSSSQKSVVNNNTFTSENILDNVDACPKLGRNKKSGGGVSSGAGNVSSMSRSFRHSQQLVSKLRGPRSVREQRLLNNGNWLWSCSICDRRHVSKGYILLHIKVAHSKECSKKAANTNPVRITKDLPSQLDDNERYIEISSRLKKCSISLVAAEDMVNYESLSNILLDNGASLVRHLDTDDDVECDVDRHKSYKCSRCEYRGFRSLVVKKHFIQCHPSFEVVIISLKGKSCKQPGSAAVAAASLLATTTSTDKNGTPEHSLAMNNKLRLKAPSPLYSCYDVSCEYITRRRNTMRDHYREFPNHRGFRKSKNNSSGKSQKNDEDDEDENGDDCDNNSNNGTNNGSSNNNNNNNSNSGNKNVDSDKKSNRSHNVQGSSNDSRNNSSQANNNDNCNDEENDIVSTNANTMCLSKVACVTTTTSVDNINNTGSSSTDVHTSVKENIAAATSTTAAATTTAATIASTASSTKQSVIITTSSALITTNSELKNSNSSSNNIVSGLTLLKKMFSNAGTSLEMKKFTNSESANNNSSSSSINNICNNNNNATAHSQKLNTVEISTSNSKQHITGAPTSSSLAPSSPSVAPSTATSSPSKCSVWKYSVDGDKYTVDGKLLKRPGTRRMFSKDCEERYRCVTCGYRSKLPTTLKQHMVAEHLEIFSETAGNTNNAGASNVKNNQTPHCIDVRAKELRKRQMVLFCSHLKCAFYCKDVLELEAHRATPNECPLPLKVTSSASSIFTDESNDQAKGGAKNKESSSRDVKSSSSSGDISSSRKHRRLSSGSLFTDNDDADDDSDGGFDTDEGDCSNDVDSIRDSTNTTSKSSHHSSSSSSSSLTMKSNNLASSKPTKSSLSSSASSSPSPAPVRTNKSYQCATCPFTTLDITSVKSHLLEQHSDLIAPPPASSSSSSAHHHHHHHYGKNESSRRVGYTEISSEMMSDGNFMTSVTDCYIDSIFNNDDEDGDGAKKDMQRRVKRKSISTHSNSKVTHNNTSYNSPSCSSNNNDNGLNSTSTNVAAVENSAKTNSSDNANPSDSNTTTYSQSSADVDAADKQALSKITSIQSNGFVNNASITSSSNCSSSNISCSSSSNVNNVSNFGVFDGIMSGLMKPADKVYTVL
ncbi:hypothetical protein HELRODRAFT_191561 [Helobdella robusta]|uniref:C2H2-type domain-containing protein n=1 Tax=Helobdella robusta TaxID=6412 RepID=T1FT30_HELRO|nr:hypothetical protein HELRODRAFT_191561 [Helobdella robusta]ESO05031.1 hypothetical protein HELRODRAFT_191561 [Helobdella robusta]